VSVGDPHIHVERNLHRQAAVRTMMASTFGLVSDLPSQVTTGCGVRVPYAMTSPRPEKVTCLPCREHAARWHAMTAEQFEQMNAPVGLALPGDDLTQAAARHRDQARRFGGG
jgi:hypothetical protein